MMHGSVAVRRASGPLPPLPAPLQAMHHFPPIAVDSLHHHHANNHNSHQHMARVKAGVARASSSSASSSSVSSGGAPGSKEAAARMLDQSRSSSASSSGVAERLGGGGGLERRSSAGGATAGTAERAGEKLTPRRFLEKYSLPRVVRVVAEPGTDRRLSGPLAEPLLLYRQYTSCKVVARSLRRDKPLAKQGLGPPLVIPDTYQGWFSLVRERSLQTRAKVYSSVQQLVSARVAVFLTKNSVTGFKLAPSPGADGDVAGVGRRLQYSRSSVHGGQVLRLLAVFEDNEGGRASTRSRSGSRRGGSQPQQYAQCLTARSESVFVPVSTSGTFYAVATEDACSSNADVSDLTSDQDADLTRVYQLPQLLRLTADPLPVKVQLVCGPIQNPLPTGFSGLLLLEDLQQEDVVLACTLPRSWALPPSAAISGDAASASTSSSSAAAAATSGSNSNAAAATASDKPIFLEMDADSKFLVTRPLASREAEARFFKTPLLRRVLAYCRERADLWSSQIKVTHHVFPASEAGAASGKAAAVVMAASPPASLASRGGSSAPQQQNGEHRITAASAASAVQGLFRSKDSHLGGKESSLSSGGTKKSQSFRYASPAMMVSTGSSSSSSGSGGAGANTPEKQQASGSGSAGGSVAGRLSRGRDLHGAHPLLQQLQSLPGIKNFLRRSSSVSPAPHTEDVPLSVVFPELFGQQPPGEPSGGTPTTEGGGGGGIEGSVSVAGVSPGAPAGGRQHLRFYADDLPYGRVADAIPPEAAVSASSRDYRRRKPRRRLYDDDDDEDDEERNEDLDDEDRANEDNENIYAEICECPRGVVVSGARVILTTACSEERRGYFTFASATSKDQYYTGGSDGTFSGTMSSSNPSNPEEDIYDTVC